MLLLACGDPEVDDAGSAGIPNQIFAPCDTIGSMYGDTCDTFGTIAEVEIMPDGGVAVLDGIASRIRFYDSGDSYLGSVGGKGSGPGEFLYPTSFTFLEGGGLAVSDWSARTIWMFDDSMNFRGDLGHFDPGAPSPIESAGDGYILGQSMSMQSGESGLTGESYLGLWRESPDPEVIFHSSPLEISMSGEDRIEIGYQRLLFDSDSVGNVYMAQVSDSSYSLTAFRRTGELLFEVDAPWERIPRTDAEMALERDLQYQEAETGDIPAYRNAIEGLFVSGKGEIWVRRGSSLHPAFDVYSSSGDLLYMADIPCLEDTLFRMQFASAGSLLVAWDIDPVDYPKVIFFQSEGRPNAIETHIASEDGKGGGTPRPFWQEAIPDGCSPGLFLLLSGSLCFCACYSE